METFDLFNKLLLRIRTENCVSFPYKINIIIIVTVFCRETTKPLKYLSATTRIMPCRAGSNKLVLSKT